MPSCHQRLQRLKQITRKLKKKQKERHKREQEMIDTIQNNFHLKNDETLGTNPK